MYDGLLCGSVVVACRDKVRLETGTAGAILNECVENHLDRNVTVRKTA